MFLSKPFISSHRDMQALELIKDKLGESYDCCLVTAEKDNDVSLVGVSITEKDSDVSVVLYFDDTRDCIEDAKDAANRIVELFMSGKVNFNHSYDLRSFRNYNAAKKKFGIKLSSSPAKGVVKRKAFADLYMTVYIKVEDFVKDGHISVREDLLKEWGIDEDTLFADAIKYAKVNHPAKFYGLGGIFPGAPSCFRILSNESKVYGASAILYADNLPDEFYLLPSSIHEVIIIDDVNIPQDRVDYLSEMVRFVNQTEVEDADILAYHAYHYKDGCFEII